MRPTVVISVGVEEGTFAAKRLEHLKGKLHSFATPSAAVNNLSGTLFVLLRFFFPFRFQFI